MCVQIPNGDTSRASGLGGVPAKIKSDRTDEEEIAQLGREDACSTEELMLSLLGVIGSAPFLSLI